MHLNRVIFDLKVIYILLMFCPILAQAESDCMKLIDNYKIKNCRTWTDPSVQLQCLQELERLLPMFCDRINPTKNEAEQMTSSLVRVVSDLSKIEVGSEEYELSRIITTLKGFNSILDNNLSNINSLRAGGVNLYLDNKYKIEALVNNFDTKINDEIERIRQSGSADDLVAIEYELQSTYLEFAKNINTLDITLSKYIQSSVMLASNITDSIDNAHLVFDDLGLDADLKMRSEAIENMRKELVKLESAFYSTIRRLVGFCRQQAALYRFDDLNIGYAELKREAFEVERIRSYFLEIDRLVQDVVKPVKSNFYNMPFLVNQIQAARQLLTVAEMCRISDTPSWQSLGCERALAYETNASRVATTVATATMNFASTRLFVNIDDESLSDDINSLKIALGSNDVLACAQIYDYILSEL